MYCVLSDGSVEEIPFTYEDGILTFKTKHLSIFCVETDPEQGGFDWIPVVIIGSIVLIAAAATAMVIKKRHKKGRGSS